MTRKCFCTLILTYLLTYLTNLKGELHVLKTSKDGSVEFYKNTEPFLYLPIPNQKQSWQNLCVKSQRKLISIVLDLHKLTLQNLHIKESHR